jgi:hypothetical protein
MYLISFRALPDLLRTADAHRAVLSATTISSHAISVFAAITNAAGSDILFPWNQSAAI